MYARLRCGGNLPLCLAFGTGEGLLRYGICARCKKQASVVRGAFSEAFGVKNRLLRYGRDIRCQKQHLPHRTHLQCAKRPPLGGD